MSSENPKTAINALMPKTYEFKGKRVHNSNLAMIALEQCGFSLSTLSTKSAQAASLVAYVFTHEEAEVIDSLSDGTLKNKALLEVSSYTTEEFAKAVSIFADCITRFNQSITDYFDPRSKGKNARTA